MKKLFIAILALAAFASAANCDYDKAIRSFENRLGNAAAVALRAMPLIQREHCAFPCRA